MPRPRIGFLEGQKSLETLQRVLQLQDQPINVHDTVTASGGQTFQYVDYRNSSQLKVVGQNPALAELPVDFDFILQGCKSRHGSGAGQRLQALGRHCDQMRAR